MNCPRCLTARLHPHTRESGLAVLACRACDGTWIEAVHYWTWLESRDRTAPESTSASGDELHVCDGEEARVCPECTRILARCRVGNGLNFYLDRCAHCGGIWLDKHEWEVLKQHNLHDDIHSIFSKVWQDRILREEKAATRERWLIEHFGEEGLARVKEFRDWLNSQAYRSAIIRYLSEDPHAPK